MLNSNLYSCCNANAFSGCSNGEVVASPNDITFRFCGGAALKGEALTGLADDAKAFAQTIADTLAAKNSLIISGNEF